MNLELNKLYQYLFGNWADFENNIKMKNLEKEAEAKSIKSHAEKTIQFFRIRDRLGSFYQMSK